MCLQKNDAIHHVTMKLRGNITNNLKVKIIFTLPDFSVTNILTWNYHMDESNKGRYDMILCGNISTALGLKL